VRNILTKIVNNMPTLLIAHGSPEIELLAITTMMGDSTLSDVSRNALALAALRHRTVTPGSPWTSTTPGSGTSSSTRWDGSESRDRGAEDRSAGRLWAGLRVAAQDLRA
jgi:hypothetical protein